MKRILLLLLTYLCTSQEILAQEIQPPNYDQISSLINQEDDNNYNKLIARLKINDSTLNDAHYYVLYYGQALQANYAPYSTSNMPLMELLKKKKEEEYLHAAKSYLKENPFDLRVRDYLLDILYEKKDTSELKVYAKAFYGFIDAISISGKGTEKESPHHVMSVTDEYVFMRYVGLHSVKQKLSYPCDVMTLAENKYGIKELYFDVSAPFKTLDSKKN